MPKKNSTTDTKKKKSTSNKQIKLVITFAVAIFLMCVVCIKGQNVWTYMHNFMFGIFGFAAFLAPIFIGFIAVIEAMDKMTRSMLGKTVGIGALIVLMQSCVEVCIAHDDKIGFWSHIGNIYTANANGKGISGGGFLGALIGEPICRLFGNTGAIVTIALLIFVLVMVLTGTTLIAFFKAVAKPVKAVSEQAENAYHTRAEKKEEEKKKLKVLKGFNVDVDIDDTPNDAVTDEDINKKKRILVSSYYDEESSDKIVAELPQNEAEDADIDEALDATENEAEEGKSQPQEKITVDFEKEKQDFVDKMESAPPVKKYKFPPTYLLKETRSGDAKALAAELDSTADHLVKTLRSFGVETRIVDISKGPTVTRYELQPCAGVKISKITNLADDIALNLAATGVRIEAPIPGKAAVGIEVPNKMSAVVGIREIIESPAFLSSKSKLTVAMGRDIGGNVVVADIAKMPHGLIAGATGSGKSVCINSIIMSILYKASPDDVKLLMIDPKVVELGVYNGIPHLLVPVVTDPRKAAGALGWAVTEMERRYKMFADRGVRDIEGYNKFIEGLMDEPEVTKLPHVVIIIDELADLMITAPKEVEDSINRIAAKARAAGMHLLIATQRPSVDVVTGVIKANIPSRIAFAVSSQIDSRTILDGAGAEKLLGRGDMLFAPIGANMPKRLQGCFVSDEEVERVVEFVKNSGSTVYDDNIMVEIERQAAIEKQKKTGVVEDGPEGDDPMLEDAIKVVVEQGQASTSLLQRKLKLGYARAARIIDEMEERGIVGGYEGSKPRKVLISKEQLMERSAMGQDE